VRAIVAPSREYLEHNCSRNAVYVLFHWVNPMSDNSVQAGPKIGPPCLIAHVFKMCQLICTIYLNKISKIGLLMYLCLGLRVYNFFQLVFALVTSSVVRGLLKQGFCKFRRWFECALQQNGRNIEYKR